MYLKLQSSRHPHLHGNQLLYLLLKHLKIKVLKVKVIKDKDKAPRTKVLKTKGAVAATVKVINSLLLHLISQLLIQIGARMDRRVKVVRVKVAKTKALKDKAVRNKAVTVKTNPILLLA